MMVRNGPPPKNVIKPDPSPAPPPVRTGIIIPDSEKKNPEEPIEAGKGKKERRKKRTLPKIPNYGGGYSHEEYAVHVNPLIHCFGGKEMLKYELIKKIEQKGKIFHEDSIREEIKLLKPDGETENLSDIIYALFPNSKYIFYKRKNFMANNSPQSFGEFLGRRKDSITPVCYTLMPQEEDSSVELVDITIPKDFDNNPINDPEIKKSYFTNRGFRPNTFAIEILFKDTSYPAKRGIVIPLTVTERRIPEKEQSKVGHLLDVEYGGQQAIDYPEYPVGSCHYYIFDYANTWAKGIEIAIKEKRVYRDQGRET